ncbi:sucrose synthase [Lyngbya confervoides]|uniref:Sucrose synthase n=1 Tax=Lyngbya confervoides BDU141951 TaxID=1574623 RepID=A0ABD4T450_9CYAN|nr:sucrose synthase [Lyngbya confervoides]MCM1983454.1 sucrose synthase [Lyngbya confervoides BDU141951]
MENLIKTVLQGEDCATLAAFIQLLRSRAKHYFLRNEILQEFAWICKQHRKPAYFFYSSPLGELMGFTHEILLDPDSFWLILRPRVANQSIYRISADLETVARMGPRELLDRRDRHVHSSAPPIFEIDFEPFFDPDLTIEDERNIGHGLEFLKRRLLDWRRQDPALWLTKLFDLLQNSAYGDLPLLINDQITSLDQVRQALQAAYPGLDSQPPQTPYLAVAEDLRGLGLEAGWGNSVQRIKETFDLLERVIEFPDPAVFEALLQRIPLIFRVVSVSVHGWVAQEDVLGKAETGGQVAYVFDQALYLEQQLRECFDLAGLSSLQIKPEVVIVTRLIPECEGTHCNYKIEPIQGTQFAKILRVPFRDDQLKPVESWVSKFEVWPYLDRFVEEVTQELEPLFHHQPPDLFLGHNSDGNLVAARLARRFKALHGGIAHALEKSKHLFSDLYWQDLEAKYHFSIQFSADLISMNAAHFILTSSHQEITGSYDNLGQYESYQCFTMPQLYHVVNGINLRSARFNVVPPGINEAIFFPHSQKQRRSVDLTHAVETLLFDAHHPDTLGQLRLPEKRPILAFAPVLAIKNLTGLLEAFGRNRPLREHCNLILLTGMIHPEAAVTADQRQLLKNLHRILDQYQLISDVRWIGQRLPGDHLAEAYRIIADRQGVLFHGGRFEAFGLTLLEAMVTGIPVFATQFGGPAEIIEPDRSGFLINPTQLDEAMDQVLEFVLRCEREPDLWHTFSQQAIERVQKHYRWDQHVKSLLTIASLHRFTQRFNRQSQRALACYLNALYALLFQSRLSAPLPLENWRPFGSGTRAAECDLQLPAAP